MTLFRTYLTLCWILKLVDLATRRAISLKYQHFVVTGYVDTLITVKREFPYLSSYKKVNLVAELLGETYEQHKGLEDVKAVQKLSDLVKDKLWTYRFRPEENDY